MLGPARLSTRTGRRDPRGAGARNPSLPDGFGGSMAWCWARKERDFEGAERSRRCLSKIRGTRATTAVPQCLEAESRAELLGTVGNALLPKYGGALGGCGHPVGPQTGK